ncbi:hypothetical protein [Pedobacter frigoris]|uniref:hypothetical protein n=1 Tax=Pedobacter frigoris TaxID=2571272 RepID=UPI00293137F9|nr:hypothetical protein [Pedobacter frigoris]
MNIFYKILNIAGVVFALWFAVTAWLWTYNGALYISYPFGLISLLILLFSPSKYGKKIMKYSLAIGFIVSMMALLFYR